jgi:hypothetical protein
VQSEALGVVHDFVASCNETPKCALELGPDSEPSLFVVVGHSWAGDEPDPFTFVKGAHVCRGYARPFKTRNDFGQGSENVEPLSPIVERNDSWRLLHERVVGSQAAKQSEELGPEPSLVEAPESLADLARWLAGDAGGDESEVVGDSGDTARERAPSDAGEEVDLFMMSNF